MNHTDKFGITPVTEHLFRLFPKEHAQRNPIGRVRFLLVFQGGALVEIDERGYLLHEGSFVFLLPNMQLRGLSHTKEFRFQSLFFDFDYLSDFPLLLGTDLSDEAINAPSRNLDPDEFRLMRRYFDFIHDRHLNCPHSLSITQGLLFSLIAEVTQLYTNRHLVVDVSRQEELTDSFFRLLHAHYKERRNAAFYADRLCVSDKHLMRTIKQKTGQTFHFWLSDFLIREAKILLKSTDKSITAISDELHFPNSSFFARFFRRHTGMSPLLFRKQ